MRQCGYRWATYPGPVVSGTESLSPRAKAHRQNIPQRSIGSDILYRKTEFSRNDKLKRCALANSVAGRMGALGRRRRLFLHQKEISFSYPPTLEYQPSAGPKVDSVYCRIEEPWKPSASEEKGA